MYSVIYIIEGRIPMNKNDLNEIKKSNEQAGDNEVVNEPSNVEVANMYNMPNMISGPSGDALEEKRKLYGRSSINKGISRK